MWRLINNVIRYVTTSSHSQVSQPRRQPEGSSLGPRLTKTRLKRWTDTESRQGIFTRTVIVVVGVSFEHS